MCQALNNSYFSKKHFQENICLPLSYKCKPHNKINLGDTIFWEKKALLFTNNFSQFVYFSCKEFCRTN